MLGGNTSYWDALTTSFQKQYPYITINWERVPGLNFQTKWNAYIASRSGPDLVSIQSGAVFLPYKQALQTLPELKPLLPQFSGTQNFCDDFDCNKGIYAIPYNVQGYVLYYNKAVLQQAGLPPTAPADWTEMINACDKVKAIGKTCMALGMKDAGAFQLAFGPLPNQTMTLAQQQGYYTNKTKYTDPASVAWLKVFADMSKRGWFNPDATGITQTPDAEGLFTSGKTAFIMGFVADIEDYATMGPGVGQQNLGAAAFPSIVKDNPVPGISPGPLAKIAGISSATAFGVSVWSKQKDAALQWIRFVGSQKNQQDYLDQVGVPDRLGLDTSNAAPALKQIEDLIAKGNGSLTVWYMGFKTLNAIQTSMEQIFSGSITPDAAALAIQKAQDAP
ncbi:MAG: extracellular solute-binding protein [Candidatus Dormibacteraeota bacterium]|nr:extracellular solute-binding protein [Candidatus Dormibacteraeota bacterium]MBJ7614405.1 extracellular solute-binding protein [Candidatus Dormibacteraeota bacterium]